VMPRGIEALDLTNPYLIAFPFVTQHLSGFQAQSLANFLGRPYVILAFLRPYRSDSAFCK
jgi:hypothetical protein